MEREMPYVYVEPELFMEHGDVEVFHVYRDGTDEPWDYWFTTNPETADASYGHGSGGHFDTRMLAGKWEDTPTIVQWEDFWRRRFKTEDDAIEALIKSAIDNKVIPHSSEKP